MIGGPHFWYGGGGWDRFVMASSVRRRRRRHHDHHPLYHFRNDFEQATLRHQWFCQNQCRRGGVVQ